MRTPGCLETRAAEPAILREVEERLRLGIPSAVVRDTTHSSDGVTIEAIYAAALANDPVCLDTVQVALRFLGVGLAVLINVLNPEVVVVSGGISRLGDWLLNPVRDVLRERVLGDAGQATPVLVSNLGERSYPLGAAALVLQHVADGSILSRSWS